MLDFMIEKSSSSGSCPDRMASATRREASRKACAEAISSGLPKE